MDMAFSRTSVAYGGGGAANPGVAARCGGGASSASALQISDVAVRRELELKELDELAALLRDGMEGASGYTDALHHAAGMLLDVMKQRWLVACGLSRPGYADKTWVTA
jgi:hypothetical protein